jgi:creatinine amidohydrolase/Fe(II)-dependent formamide hydrolase-like protein
MADYYARQSAGDDPFNWIKAHPLMPSSFMQGYPFDHAGQGETSLLLALLREGVDRSRISDDKWYSRSARDASLDLGVKGRDCILAHLRKALGVERANAHVTRN